MPGVPVANSRDQVAFTRVGVPLASAVVALPGDTISALRSHVALLSGPVPPAASGALRFRSSLIPSLRRHNGMFPSARPTA